MKLTVWIALLCLAFAASAPAQSLDDQYVRVYSLIQQADTLLEARHGQAAIGKYVEAEAGLKKFQASYPNWNDTVISFRLRYVAEKLEEARKLAAAAPAIPAPIRPAVSPAGPSVPDAPAATARLEEEIRRLQGQNSSLEAKLREALSAQPAATDPREMAKVQDRIRILQKENEILKVSLTQEKDRSARAADPALLEKIRGALADSTLKLTAQADVIASLRKENSDLQARVVNNPDLARMRTDNQALRTENQSLKSEIATLKPQLTAAAGELAKQLAAAKSQLTAQQANLDKLTLEKTALENRLRGATPTPAAAPNTTILTIAEARALNDKIISLEKELGESRKSMADAATSLEKLQKEKSTLVTKVAEYALNAAMAQPPKAQNVAARTGKTAAPATVAITVAMTERIDVLRARLEILEARPIPYTPEELALFKAPEKIASVPLTAARKSSRVLPSGAATLVSQAERAFNEQRLDDAEKLYRQVVRMDDRNVYTLANLAAIQLEKGQLNEAEGNLQRALEEAPGDAYSLSLMGIAKFRKNQFDDALNCLSRAAQMEPNNPETQNYLGVALSQKGLRGAAETALRKAVQLSPGYASAHHNLAVVYATAQPPSVELARYHYNKAIASGHPKNDQLEKVLTRKASVAN